MEKTSAKKKLFGGEIEIMLFGMAEPTAKRLVGETYNEGLRLQKIFNFFDRNSELSMLNSKKKMKVSKELLEVISMALKFAKMTNGEYDISLGKRIMQRKGVAKSAQSNCSYKNIKVKGSSIVFDRPDVMVDLGSIAKGYITDRMGDFLKKKGANDFLIDSRGDILVSGNSAHVIGIQHPRKNREEIGAIKIKNEAVATSGDYRQFNKTFENSHIVNQKDLVSLTVVAPTLAEADVYATALFVCEQKLREKIIKANKKIKVLAVDKNLSIKSYNGFDKLLYKK